MRALEQSTRDSKFAEWRMFSAPMVEHPRLRGPLNRSIYLHLQQYLPICFGKAVAVQRRSATTTEHVREEEIHRRRARKVKACNFTLDADVNEFAQQGARGSTQLVMGSEQYIYIYICIYIYVYI